MYPLYRFLRCSLRNAEWLELDFHLRMVVCNYFLRGQCRFGDKCRNEHPQSGNQSWVNSASGSNTGNKDSAGLFSQESLLSDITLGKEKPLWPLSSYGPAKYEPDIVVGLDTCPEELRVKAWEAKVQNNVNGYIQYEADKIAQADRSFNNARGNIQMLYDQAIQQSSVISSSLGAPSSAFPSSSSAFVSSSNGAFGSNNAFPSSSSAPSIFGSTSGSKPAFSSSTSSPAFASGNNGAFSSLVNKNPTTSAFGTPSTSNATSAFGQPSVLGANNSLPFGKPSSSVFGQPSALGATGSTFGQTPSTTNPTSAFGFPSTTTTSAFGQPSTFGSAPAASTTPAHLQGLPVVALVRSVPVSLFPLRLVQILEVSLPLLARSRLPSLLLALTPRQIQVGRYSVNRLQLEEAHLRALLGVILQHLRQRQHLHLVLWHLHLLHLHLERSVNLRQLRLLRHSDNLRHCL
ncbi:hypothetical protein DFJ43DRAFT_112159 [Lentinula guzmanii]|uniref:C3H1-type domain-containing protein n=1 Tax=Lentinula guzmanii TaxID=2804957 RepID=A0AA38J5J5_9AGAR|nr:hypothetical protein DFJ43DRAFT_112159 [Lentinula guzmanii]